MYRNCMIIIWIMLVFLTPLYLYGVNEGYSVITESSPWGIVMGKDNYFDFGPETAEDWDTFYEPRLDSMLRCGLSWVRPMEGPALYIGINGELNFRGMDSMVIYLQERDMNKLRPGWPYRSYWENDTLRWIQYWTTVVKRYDGDGDSHDMDRLIKPIKYWNIINEPDLNNMRPKCAGETPVSVRQYLRISGKAIHDADPTAKVVAPTLATGGWYDENGWWLDTLLWNLGDTVIIDNDILIVDTFRHHGVLKNKLHGGE